MLELYRHKSFKVSLSGEAEVCFAPRDRSYRLVIQRLFYYTYRCQYVNHVNQSITRTPQSRTRDRLPQQKPSFVNLSVLSHLAELSGQVWWKNFEAERTYNLKKLPFKKQYRPNFLAGLDRKFRHCMVVWWSGDDIFLQL